MPRTRTTALRAPRDAPGLSDVVKVAIRNEKLRIRTALPARIVTYDAARQIAEVQLELLAVMNTETGEQVQKPIKLVEIPVAWPRTAMGYLTFPLAPNDTGLVIVSDRSIDKWTTQGVTTDPGFNHTHNPIDGVFYPGLHPDTAPIVPPTSGSDTVLEGTTAIQLGAGATLFVALESLVAAQLTVLSAAISAGAITPGDGGAAFKASLIAALAGWPATMASTKVKAV